MSRERRHYWAIRAFVVGGFITSLVVLWAMSVRQYLALFNRTTDCGCAVAPLQWSATMIIGSSLLALATLYLTTRIVIEVVRRGQRHNHFAYQLAQRGRLVHNHVLGASILIVPDLKAQAMTVGLWQPRIMITTGLIQELSGSEISSVLRHEQAHARAYDPLWSLLLEAIGATLSWIGGLRDIVNTAFSLREIIADSVATVNYTKAQGLSGAIYKLATTTPPAAIPAFSPNADRVTKLLNTTWELPVRWWSWRTAVLGIVMAIGVWFASELPAATVAAQPAVTPTAACWLREIMCAQPPTHIILMSPDSLMSKYGW